MQTTTETPHERSRRRRKEIAASVRSGMSSADVSKQFDVSMALVWAACAEHGVRIPRSAKTSQPRTYCILRRLWDGVRVKDIAEEFDVSEGLVFKIKANAIKNGWPELKGKRDV